MRLFDDRILNRFPAGFLVPDKPVIADLIENDKRLVADFGKLRSPAGAAFDGIVRLDHAHNDNLAAAAHLPADALQDFAEQGSPRVLPVHEFGDVGQAHILESQFLAGKDSHAALALYLMPLEAVVHLFDAPSFSQRSEKLLCSGGTAAVKNTLPGIEHACLPIRFHMYPGLQPTASLQPAVSGVSHGRCFQRKSYLSYLVRKTRTGQGVQARLPDPRFAFVAAFR